MLVRVDVCVVCLEEAVLKCVWCVWRRGCWVRVGVDSACYHEIAPRRPALCLRDSQHFSKRTQRCELNTHTNTHTHTHTSAVI